MLIVALPGEKGGTVKDALKRSLQGASLHLERLGFVIVGLLRAGWGQMCVVDQTGTCYDVELDWSTVVEGNAGWFADGEDGRVAARCV